MNKDRIVWIGFLTILIIAALATSFEEQEYDTFCTNNPTHLICLQLWRNETGNTTNNQTYLKTDYICLGGETTCHNTITGGGPNPFNQNLNTTDNASFTSINSTALNLNPTHRIRS